MSACILLFQTPGLWIDEGAEQGSPHQRSASWGSADHLKEVDSLVLNLVHPSHSCFWQQTLQWINTGSAVSSLSDCSQMGLKPSHNQFKEMFLSFLRFIRFTQNVFYLSRSEVSLNIMVLNVGFHSCLSARLGGQPADHMELLALQLSRPQSKFNLLLPSCFPTQLHPYISLWPVVFERQCRSSSRVK